MLRAAEICLISSFILHNQIALKKKIIGKEGQEERGNSFFSVMIYSTKLHFVVFFKFGQVILDLQTALTAKQECLSQSEE